MELIQIQPTEHDVITTDDMDFIIQQAEKRVEIIRKFKSISLKATEPSDWVLQDGKPFLCCSGAEKIAPLWGISVSDIESKKTFSEDKAGQSYIYLTTGLVKMKGREPIAAIGTCSSRHKLWAVTRDSEGNKIFRDISEVDETNIMKASYSNFFVNGVTRLLGLRGIPLTDLQAAGIDTTKIPGIDYEQKGERKGKQALSAEDAAKAGEINKWILEMMDGNADSAKQYLESITSFETRDGKKVSGKKDALELTAKQITYHHPTLKAKHAEAMKGGKGNANAA